MRYTFWSQDPFTLYALDDDCREFLVRGLDLPVVILEIKTEKNENIYSFKIINPMNVSL